MPPCSRVGTVGRIGGVFDRGEQLRERLCFPPPASQPPAASAKSAQSARSAQVAQAVQLSESAESTEAAPFAESTKSAQARESAGSTESLEPVPASRWTLWQMRATSLQWHLFERRGGEAQEAAQEKRARLTRELEER